MVQSIKKATIISYITLILGNIISLIYIPFMLSMLGSKEYGLFSLVNTIIAYIYLLDMGVGSAVVRYNSKYIAENDIETLNNVNGMFLLFYSLISFIGIILGYILYNNLELIFGNGLSIYEINKLKIMFLISIINVAFSFPMNVFNGIILANERFIFIKLLSLIRTVFNPIVMISVLHFGYKAIGMLTASTIFNISLGFINILYCFVVLKIKIKFTTFNRSLCKEILKYSFFVFLGSIAYQIYWNTDQVILGMAVSSSAISIYSLGSQFNSYFISFSNVISGMFLPKLTKIVSLEKNDYKIMNILIKVSRIQFFISSLILIGFMLIGREFIKLWVGKGYNLSYYIALLIMVPHTLSIIQSLFATLLEAMNKHKVKSFIYLAVAILNLVLTLILVEEFGAIGCAIGTSIGMTLNAVFNNLYYKYKLKLNMRYYWKEMAKLLPPTIICFGIGRILVKYMNLDSYISIGIFIIVFMCIYFLVYWILVFNDYEKNTILAIFHKLKLSINCLNNKSIIKE